MSKGKPLRLADSTARSPENFASRASGGKRPGPVSSAMNTDFFWVGRVPLLKWQWLSKPTVPFWGRCTIYFRTYFSGDWDVHSGYRVLTHVQIDYRTKGLSLLVFVCSPRATRERQTHPWRVFLGELPRLQHVGVS